jgi:hypothetical protein
LISNLETRELKVKKENKTKSKQGVSQLQILIFAEKVAVIGHDGL